MPKGEKEGGGKGGEEEQNWVAQGREGGAWGGGGKGRRSRELSSPREGTEGRGRRGRELAKGEGGGEGRGRGGRELGCPREKGGRGGGRVYISVQSDVKDERVT